MYRNSSCGLDHFYYYPTVLSLLCFYWKRSCSLGLMKTNAAVTSPFWLCFLRKAIRSYFDFGGRIHFFENNFTLIWEVLYLYLTFSVLSLRFLQSFLFTDLNHQWALWWFATSSIRLIWLAYRFKDDVISSHVTCFASLPACNCQCSKHPCSEWQFMAVVSIHALSVFLGSST